MTGVEAMKPEPAAPRVEHLLTSLDIAKKLAGGGVRPGIDSWAKTLQEWLDSYIDRWKAEEKVWHAALDPLEDGREEFERWAKTEWPIEYSHGLLFDRKTNRQYSMIEMAGAWKAWTARAARERELRKALEGTYIALRNNLVASGITRWERDSILGKAEAALSDTQPDTCECEENDCPVCGPRMNGN
jgi:hypothetical protein